ncbi:capreomycidine synthase [Amycolatopsis antarctica]|uniref:Capreomycidine synthase n=1 Tax=Amycolatopsis antarctica TaxID=1854586 RepID=A0A263D394_9PSEU|nr:capreomycidine synthase [Amycolatopsis antarctica]OZM72920.1 capreomycidine synthase [Amycolatopsis antarctica]
MTTAEANPLPRARLEDWLRDRYFDTSVDISGSGVQDYTLGEVLDLAGAPTADLRELVFRDSHSLGGPELREAIARRFAGGRTDLVMATQGSSEGIYLAARTLLRPGDEIVVPGPGYHSPSLLAESIGCRVRTWELGHRDGAVSNVDELVAMIGPGTRAVAVNFPHNPTGATITPEEQRALVDACDSVGAYLFWDGAFTHLTYDRPPLPDPALAYPRALSFGTLSKGYGLPGLRVGWCLAHPEVLAECVRLRDYVSLALSPLTELVARHAIEHADALLAPRLAQATRNRALVGDWVAEHTPLVRWERPAGGVAALPELTAIPDTEPFAEELLRTHGVLVVPGTCFGRPGHIRLGFGGPTNDLRQGLQRLADLLSTRGGRHV